ncbi:MAG: hypothetical protein GYB67_07050 [Chloroflexi bacterium]|nr:hypothetical protein [Chloroflexota bacterium]
MDSSGLTLVFAIFTLVGVLYFVISLFSGGDILGSMEIDLPGLADASGFGCSIVAAFLAGFGAIGLLGAFSGWSLITTILASVVAGLVFGRAALAVFRFVIGQQSPGITDSDDLIGTSARVLIDVPAGKTGEAMTEGQFVQKYPVREVNNAPMQRGDSVEVVNVNGGILYVKKKRL